MPQTMPAPDRKTRRDHNSETTKRDILDVARRQFGSKGYTATSLSTIVEGASVTTGAVYHHFGDKQGLFRDVAEGVEAEIMARIAAAGAGRTDLWDILVTSTLAMLEICAEPHIQQIAFVDAPNVLGAQEWREIEKRYAFGALKSVLDGLKSAGTIRVAHTDVAAPILLGASIEAAAAVARAPGQPEILAEAQATMRRVLEALR
jgi:AcrR family transcriptional regulator